jgi:hypothetical protein
MLSDSTIYEVRDTMGTGNAVPKFKTDCWHNPNGGPAHSVPQGERYCEYCSYDCAADYSEKVCSQSSSRRWLVRARLTLVVVAAIAFVLWITCMYGKLAGEIIQTAR